MTPAAITRERSSKALTLVKWKSMKHHLLTMLPVQLLMFLVGVGTGWLPPALTYFRNTPEWGLVSNQLSWLAALHYIGKIPGTFVAAHLMNEIGRKWVFWLVAINTILMWTVVALATEVKYIYCARLMYGFSASVHETVLPIYVAEHCAPKWRGMFCTIAIIFFSLGSTTAYILSTFLSYKWQIYVNIIEVFMVVCSLGLLKETPQFLLLTGHYNQARKTFLLLQGGAGISAEQNFKDVVDNCKVEVVKFKWSVFFSSPKNRQALRVVALTTVLIMTTGYTGINNFIHKSFAEIDGVEGAHRLTVLYGITQLITVSTSSFFLDKFKRRSFLLCAAVVCFSSHFICASLQYTRLVEKTEIDSLVYPWLILGCNALYASTWIGALMPLFSIIRGELLPLNAKGAGSAIVLTLNSIISFLVAKGFLLVSELYGSYMNYVIYSIASVTLFVYVYFDLPETRGKSLVRIQRFLNQNSQEPLDKNVPKANKNKKGSKKNVVKA